MNPNLLMLLFDGLPAYRLKIYGGLVETPNIEKIIKKSTLYSNVITTSPSTAMSLTSMFTGLFPHEFGRRSYSNIDSGLPKGTISLFRYLEDIGYHTNVLWDEEMETANPIKYRINVWSGSKIQFFHFNRFQSRNKIISKIIDNKFLKRKGKIWLLEQTISTMKKLISPWALLVRFSPEVSSKFKGASINKTNFKSDDDIYEIDYIIDLLFKEYPENTKLFLLSDHGRMHGEHGIWGYAFNLCEGTLKVPLIIYDPINPKEHLVDNLISLLNFRNIVLQKPLRKSKYLYADTAYADQWHRKTMVRKANWKYIYHRDGWPCKEQLFDLSTDPHEMINLAQPNYIDPYRDDRPKGDTTDKKYSPSGLKLHGKPLTKVLPRTDWKEILAVLDELKKERKRIWAIQNVFE